MTHYAKPSWFEARVFGGTIAWLARRGISVYGSAELSVRGRSTGEWRSVPVNPLTLEGQHFLVSARGTTQWVRNMRAAGGGQLRKGRRVRPFHAIELPDGPEKTRVLRAYLARWGFEVGRFFDGATGTSSDAELAEVGRRHPIFTLIYADEEAGEGFLRQAPATDSHHDTTAEHRQTTGRPTHDRREPVSATHR
ncbi:nitroreductase/quinone reductase family protein [Streptomyces sp. NPDC057702]|uniref:nitroreductase/quinone reductase family protein n=1 Tax=unclassified Streptomyces TaxID=2593676 RepID=UPI003689204B